MQQLTPKDAIFYFETFAKDWQSSVKFEVNGEKIKFSTAAAGRYLLGVFYLIALTIPYLLDYFYSLPTVWYVVLIVSGLHFTFLLAYFMPIQDFIIDKQIKEIEIVPKDVIGRWIKSTIRIKLSDVAEVKHQKLVTRSKTTHYLTLIDKNGIKYRVMELGTWDNVEKTKAALTSLIFNETISFDDSQEPAVQFDKKMEELKQDEDAEASYLPLTMFVLTLLILIVGFFIYFSLGKTPHFTAEIEGLQPLIFKYWGICLLIYCIPIYLASRTPYQIRKKLSKRTFTVFTIMAMVGFYLSLFGLVTYFNTKLDKSRPVIKEANVVEKYTSVSKKGKLGKYTLVIQIEGVEEEIIVKHSDDLFHENVRSSLSVSVYEGYFQKKWLKVEF